MLKKCSRCNRYSQPTFVIKGEFLCEDCVMIRNPPMLLLIEPWHNPNMLLDARNGRQLKITLDMLKSCGWFLQNEREFHNISYNPRAKVIYTLRFRGKRRCNLAEWGYRYWPQDMQDCQWHC